MKDLERLWNLNRMALSYHRTHQHELANSVLLEALNSAREILPPKDPILPVLMSNLAETYRLLGFLRKAETFYQRSRELLIGIHGPHHRDVAAAEIDLAELYLQWGDPLAARDLAERVSGYLDTQDADSTQGVLETYRLAQLFRAVGDDSAAEPLLVEAQTVLQRQREDHPLLPVCLADLADLYCNRNDLRTSQHLYRHLLQALRRRLGERHTILAQVFEVLADLSSLSGHFRRALVFQWRSWEIWDEFAGDRHPETLAAARLLAESLSRLGKTEAAKTFRRRARTETYEDPELGDRHASQILFPRLRWNAADRLLRSLLAELDLSGTQTGGRP